MAYIQSDKSEGGCAFCIEMAQVDGSTNLIVWRGKYNFVILNRYPYTSGHLMVVPYEHQPSIEGLGPDTRAEMMELTNKCMVVLRSVYKPQGFNLGANIGEAAGAGIRDHVHMHVVPRWVGDTNYMSSVGETRVMPETLEDTYHRVRLAWESDSTMSDNA